MTNRGNAKWWAYFHCFDRFGSPILVQVGSGKAGGDIYGFSSNKTLSADGNLDLQLVPHPAIDYITHIRPNSVCEFWVDNGDGTEPSCSTYFVERVSRQRSAQADGAVQDVISIACTDWTRVYRDIATMYLLGIPRVQVASKEFYTLGALVRSVQAFWEIGNLSDKDAEYYSPVEYFLAMTAAFFTGIQRKPASGEDLPALDSLDVSAQGRLGMDMVIPYLAGGKTSLGYLHPLKVLDVTSMIAHQDTFYYSKPIGLIAGTLSRHNNLWDMVRSNSLPWMNELFLDTRPASERPLKGGLMPSVKRDLNAFGASTDKAVMADDPTFVDAQQIPAATTPYFGLKDKTKEEWAPTVIYRKRPYFASDLIDERAFPIQHVLSTRDIAQMDLGVSSHDVKNYFSVMARLAANNADVKGILGDGDTAILNPDSIALHGLQMMIPQADFCFRRQLTVSASARKANAVRAAIDVLRQHTKTLAQWYVRNEELVNGRIGLGHMRYDIRVGRPLRLMDERFSPGDPLIAYIESIDSSGSADGASETTLGVVRGMPLSRAQNDVVEVKASSAAGPTTGSIQFVQHGQRLPFRNPLPR